MESISQECGDVKMKRMFFVFVLLNLTTKTFGSDIGKNIKHLNWNGIEVVYLEDNRFPTFDFTLYFSDGALGDGKYDKGLTYHTLNLLDAGTEKLTQKEILEQLEFYGTEFNVDVTHEFSTLSVSGLTKDLDTTMTQICSLLRNANYPDNIVQKELSLERANLQALVASPQALAERIFREISLEGTAYSYPVAGKSIDFKNLKTKKMRERLDFFLNKVKKRIYLTGPKKVLSMEKILTNDCSLKGDPKDFVQSNKTSKKIIVKKQFIFVPVPEANQVQLRIGRFLNEKEARDKNLAALASDFLGGGFTSRLMQEVRVKRGLSYGINAFISFQKEYGRAGISTFTKNETIDKLINVITMTLAKIKSNGISDAELEKSTSGMIGAYPFKFESNTAFLGQLLLLDHIERPYSDLFNFRETVKNYNGKDVGKKIDNIFDANKQVIFVLGDRSILGKLNSLSAKYGPLKILDFKQFL